MQEPQSPGNNPWDRSSGKLVAATNEWGNNELSLNALLV